MKTVAVIGKNFGDEGKGLACAALSLSSKKTLVIRHNGGGQAGHTVEDETGRHFIHHQIGSGAEYGADTLLADTFLTDLFQLDKELKEFADIFGFTPKIYAEKNTKITIIDDVLRNMFIETARGDMRHGSCGMGINECVNRQKQGFSLSVKEVRDKSYAQILSILKDYRIKYGQKNIEAIKEDFEKNNPGKKAEYYDMLKDESILENFAALIKETVKKISIVDADADFLSGYDRIIFENAQGLLLDNDYNIYAPYLTPSKTGLHNIAAFLEKRNLKLDEVIYVTRSYVTRHGNGPLPCECNVAFIPGICKDMTNVYNEWQGSIRYAKHESMEKFVGQISYDIKSVDSFEAIKDMSVSILITHLNETDDKVIFEKGDISFDRISDELNEKYGFSNIYASHGKTPKELYQHLIKNL